MPTGIYKHNLHTEETKKKIRESVKKVMNTNKMKDKISNAKKGILFSKEHKKQLSNARKGMRFSEEHKRAISEALKGIMSLRQCGEKHWNWQNGITSERAKIYNSFRYKNWRKKVFEKDNYTCQNCGDKGVYLEAHHIKTFSKYKNLRFIVSNGITLCKKCHNLTKRKEDLFEDLFIALNKRSKL